MKKINYFISVLSLIILSSCNQESDVASANISTAAHQFEIYRRVVFYNGITDTYILQIEGYCSVEEKSGKLSVIVKLPNGEYLKHYLGLSDNVTYFAEQLKSKKVSVQNYRVIFKPSTIIPKIEVK